jgi:signal transduction histidine kinase
MINNKILVVDDESGCLESLEHILKDEPYELSFARSADGAINLAEIQTPALILLDYALGHKSGMEVVKYLRSKPKFEHTKIIMISGLLTADLRLELYQAGANDIVAKPYFPEELIAKIKIVMDSYNYEAITIQENQSLQSLLKEKYEQFRKTERLAYVGINTTEIIHNLKGPIAMIKGYLTLLKRTQSNDELAVIEKATDKALNYIKESLSSVGNDIRDKVIEVQIDEVIKSCIELQQFKFRSRGVHFETELACEKPVLIIRNHIHQIITNIIKNGLDAMKGSDQKELSIKTDTDGRWNIISIKDSGCGISEQNFEQIFDPFFTTKQETEDSILGKGLGLNYCKMMLESYGGGIDINSEEGKGTTVTIRLPSEEN